MAAYTASRACTCYLRPAAPSHTSSNSADTHCKAPSPLQATSGSQLRVAASSARIVTTELADFLLTS